MTAYGDFIFQAMFAATGATIVSGAVAERVKLLPFMVFVTLLVGIAYPVIGSWHWGGGWLSEAGFYDFAGSSVVHAFGGFAALACVMILGPRAGKYVDGKIKPIPGHSMPLAAIGVFLTFLRLVWFQRWFCTICKSWTSWTCIYNNCISGLCWMFGSYVLLMDLP